MSDAITSRAMGRRMSSPSLFGGPLQKSELLATPSGYPPKVGALQGARREDDGTPRVHRVVAAVDCGMTVNALTIERQIESAIVYGLSAALYGRITFKDGRVEQLKRA
jgi:isoquinoline 1-oxidoreductase beta subunit